MAPVCHIRLINLGEFESWSGEDEFRATRHRQIEEHGPIGIRASRFTEGGYCTLYREGALLKGRGGVEDIIATACQQVFDDEFGNMLTGIVGIDDEELNNEEFEVLTRLVVEQLEQRIPGPNVPFSSPLNDQRVAETINGKIEPLEFDYEEAGLCIAGKRRLVCF